MHLRRILIPVAAATGVLTLGGAAVSAEPTRVGIETFTFTTDITSEGGGTVTASGVIDATGVDIVVSDNEDTFDFGARGQITVFHSAVRHHDQFNEKRCTETFTETGTYVFGNGTGEWAGYDGSGTYTLRGRVTDACGDSPVGTFTVTARGPINAPGE